jgi:hypothetical protein
MTTKEESAKRFFTDAQSDLMTAVLDRIIPADKQRPGAGESGVAAWIDGAVARSVHMRRLFARGLPQIEIRARSAFAGEFSELSNEQKDNVLKQVEAADPDFFSELVRQTYNGYYMNPRVLELCGLEARPPQPRGHHVELGNINLVENVKLRGKVYKEVE